MKIKILVIYTQLDKQITGGQVYDNRLFEKIKKDERYELDFLTDDMLRSQNKVLFNFTYLCEYFRVRKYDIILTNSRLYTRLFLLFFFLRWTSKVKLIAVHFYVIDPTVQNRQGNDIGTQYQTGVYYTNDAAKETVERIAELAQG